MPDQVEDFSSPFHTEDLPKGSSILHDPAFNKGTAFTMAERDALGLHGLLPPHVSTQDEQVERVMDNFNRKDSGLGKYIFMIALMERNQQLFYRVVMDYIEDMLPILYTPTVGKACLEYGHIFRRPRGMYLSAEDQGRMEEILGNWHFKNPRIIVVTDGERILGLGDLGANGMGIPIGKLTLYSACAGVPPSSTLPIMLDVGTNNQALIDDDLYLGLKMPRLRGDRYDAIVDEFVTAAERRFPQAVIQFEDFGKSNAFRLLMKYRDRVCTFNDDIQGTAAVTLSGIWSAMSLKGEDLSEQKFLFYGAGSAGVGIANLIVSALVQEGMEEDEARGRICLLDSKGLLVKNRIEELDDFKRPYAHDLEFVADLQTAVERIKPTVLIGVSGQGGSFTSDILQTMADVNSGDAHRPLIMALSNPTTKAECTAEEAYKHTQGRAIFASGSPFPDVTMHGRTYCPGQGNNAYIFPGVGLGIMASGARRVTDEMFFAAAKALSEKVTDEDLALDRIYPALGRIREVSVAIAVAVADVAYSHDITSQQHPTDMLGHIRSHMFSTEYPKYVASAI
ncbi:MAG: NAD-dependent malic enzyme [Rhodospirillaceae bacterium]|jgi:malate dehydrogenase (oxaloacetate-decarboxylating)(NADP+)|nr:NAD-dependent malic enzyme [Rhodospirillaceae bacterium]MBT5243385.1 NAD-dependent malic enzyme [Rhodospirillaceae bacterium]MBT5561290.1 NAD-dependent malic enzyme [Rhodospirillaceae bacterium]MBT6243365.1 NAD-dependent malic enzyme [Rhodospirillaceae bacterium]MBT7139015.1 NAD-dependent malic enzyme [Rhodospirillaceae bacterium]